MGDLLFSGIYNSIIMTISNRMKVAGVLCFKAAKEHFSTVPRVSVINLHGTIMPGKGSPLGGKLINIESTRKMIDKAFKPRRLEAVLLSINSPGGSPVQSDLVSSYIREKSIKH